MWADFKFGPINLYNVWPTQAMIDIHIEYGVDATWW